MNPYTLHHVGVAVADMQVAIDEYATLFQYRLTGGPYDDPIQKVSVCFLQHESDGTVVELVSPFGEKSPIDGILKRRPGTYHLCYETDDLQVTIEHFTEQSAFLVSGPTPAVAFQMRPIAWMLTKTGLLVELLQR
jgi:methylmalonyl-CoA/ethylmalonyl-CoA epimerase